MEVTREYQSRVIERNSEELQKCRSNTVPQAKVPGITGMIQVKKCYTCVPKPYVERFTFYRTETLLFHFDLLRRPYIIITPRKHVETPYDLERDELFDVFAEVDTFCKNRNIHDYQLSTNMGSWKTHAHLHWKLKIPENACHRMKTDHFALLHLERNYV